MTIPEQIEFNRPKKFRFVRELGSGACGETIHVRDEDMDCDFVIKKYSPIEAVEENEVLFSELFERFRSEARILFRLHHRNIVRVYNFFDYREYDTAYIVMEYVSGLDILDFLKANPTRVDHVFEGVAAGFAHLQECGILHRDIRSTNILVDAQGNPKLIDFGFGKKASDEDTFSDKSISLNWWCQVPPEFDAGVYDFQTEVYFVGKLFELALDECGVKNFKYRSLVRQMCRTDRSKRIGSFSDVYRAVVENRFEEHSFSDEEILVYRSFSSQLINVVSSIQSDAKFEVSVEKIIDRLDRIYRENMLEEFVSNPNKLVAAFCIGSFRYFKARGVEVSSLKAFLDFLQNLSSAKQITVIENLINKLSSTERTEPKVFDEDIPF